MGALRTHPSISAATANPVRPPAKVVDIMELLKPRRLTLNGLLASLQLLRFESSWGHERPARPRTAHQLAPPGERLDFGKAYIKYGPAVRRVLRRRGIPDPDLDDQVNNVFEKAFIKRATLRDEARLESWLMSFAVNSALNGGRKRSRDIGYRALGSSDWLESMPEEDASNPAEQAAAREGVAQLELLLRDLGELERNLVILVCCEGLSPQDAAEACQVDVGRSRRVLAKARKKLQASLARRQEREGWTIR